MKILTVNEGLSDNLGDQAIQYTLSKCLEELNVEVAFEDYSGNEEPAIMYRYKQVAIKKINIKKYLPIPKTIKFKLKCILWWWKNRKRIETVLKNGYYDCIILGGGQMIQSNGVFPTMINYWTKCIKKYTDSKIIFFGVGIGSNLESKDVKIIKRSLGRADKIYVRDHYSKHVGEKFLGYKIEYVPDIAFTIDNFLPNTVHNKRKRVLVGIPARNHIMNKQKIGHDAISEKIYLKKFKRDNDLSSVYDWWSGKILEYIDKGYEVELFYTTVTDFYETTKLRNYLFKKYSCEIKILEYSSVEELVEEIKISEIIVSGRMHALILGFVYGCRLTPFKFSQKIQSFCDEYIENNNDLKSIQNQIKEKLKKSIYG